MAEELTSGNNPKNQYDTEKLETTTESIKLEAIAIPQDALKDKDKEGTRYLYLL